MLLPMRFHTRGEKALPWLNFFSPLDVSLTAKRIASQ